MVRHSHRGFAIMSVDYMIPLRLKARTQQPANGLLVVHYQYRELFRSGVHYEASVIAGAGLAAGRTMVKTAPLPSVRLPAEIVPPITSTKPRQMARPSPVPAR